MTTVVKQRSHDHYDITEIDDVMKFVGLFCHNVFLVSDVTFYFDNLIKVYPKSTLHKASSSLHYPTSV